MSDRAYCVAPAEYSGRLNDLPPSRRSAKRRDVARPRRFVAVEASEAWVESPLPPGRAPLPDGVVLEGTSDLGDRVVTPARL